MENAMEPFTGDGTGVAPEAEVASVDEAHLATGAEVQPNGEHLPDAHRALLTPVQPPPPAPLRSPLPRSLAFTGSATLREYLERAGPEAVLQRLRLTEVRLPPEDQSFFVDYADALNLVAVVGAGLPDTPAVLPLWARIAAACQRADLRVVAEDDRGRLARLLGDDAQVDLDALDLPMLFVFDEELLLQAQWGPRPQAAEAHVDGWMALHPEFEDLAESDSPEAQRLCAELTLDLTQQMRIWYNSGLDAEASAEIRALLASLRDDAPDRA